MGNNKSETKGTRIILSIGFLFAVGAICFFIFKIPDFWPQMLAIIASAFLGAGATAWITNTLLDNKQKAEEAKERNIKVYENKIQVYSEFISKMWKTLEDDIITDEEIFEIRFDIFNKLIFYLEKEDIEELCKKVENIKNSCDNDGDDSKRTKKTIDCFSEITNLLRADVNGEGHTESTQHISELWNKFGLAPRDTQSLSNTQFETGIKPLESIEPNKSESITYNFWHFNMWGAEEQLDALRKDNGIYELNLVEYGEWWRTNLLKQVRNNDLIFLFQTGGSGYMGVFRAIGWRIFEFYDQEGDKVKVKETLNEFDKEGIEEIPGEEVSITEEEFIAKTKLQEDLKRSDIYNSREYVKDGATLCSSIIVEPLVFTKNGIGNPGGTYRRTISRYDYGYGIKQLARYRTIIEKYPDNYDDLKINNEKKGCNIEWFKKEILEKGNILPAEKDENGNWK